MLTHTEKKLYQCNQCEKAFSKNVDLKRHKRVHSDEKSFQCSHCEKVFTNNGDLKNHIMIHTSEKQSHMQIDEKNAKQFSCSECDYTTTLEL